MNRYPEYTFVASQAQQFAWLEKDYPLLFAEIQKKVRKGNRPTGLLERNWTDLLEDWFRSRRDNFKLLGDAGLRWTRTFLRGKRSFGNSCLGRGTLDLVLGATTALSG